MTNKLFVHAQTKKGTPIDLMLLPILLIALAITAFVTIQAIFDYKDAVYDDSSNASKAMIDQQVNNIGLIDNFFMFVMIGLFLIILAGSILLKASPLFTVIALLILILAIVISAPISNTFETFRNDTSYSANATNSFSKGIWVMQHLPMIILAFGLIVIIAIYIGAQVI